MQEHKLSKIFSILLVVVSPLTYSVLLTFTVYLYSYSDMSKLIILHVQKVYPPNYYIQPILPPLMVISQNSELPVELLDKIICAKPKVPLPKHCIAVSYFTFNKVPALTGASIFVCEADSSGRYIRLVYYPQSEQYQADQQLILSYGQQIKSQLMFHGQDLVYCDRLLGKGNAGVHYIKDLDYHLQSLRNICDGVSLLATPVPVNELRAAIPVQATSSLPKQEIAESGLKRTTLKKLAKEIASLITECTTDKTEDQSFSVRLGTLAEELKSLATQWDALD